MSVSLHAQKGLNFSIETALCEPQIQINESGKYINNSFSPNGMIGFSVGYFFNEHFSVETGYNYRKDNITFEPTFAYLAPAIGAKPYHLHNIPLRANYSISLGNSDKIRLLFTSGMEFSFIGYPTTFFLEQYQQINRSTGEFFNYEITDINKKRDMNVLFLTAFGPQFRLFDVLRLSTQFGYTTGFTDQTEMKFEYEGTPTNGKIQGTATSRPTFWQALIKLSYKMDFEKEEEPADYVR
jgi:hypothetical protein